MWAPGGSVGVPVHYGAVAPHGPVVNLSPPQLLAHNFMPVNSWRPIAASPPVPRPASGQQAASASYLGTVAAEDPVQTELPDGWEETLDKATGKSYYWKEEDPIGSRTWHRPSSMSSKVPDVKASRARTPLPRSPRPRLPTGWNESSDPATGGLYYWHEDDPEGTRTWTRPQTASRPRSASPVLARGQTPQRPNRSQPQQSEYRLGDTVQVWSSSLRQWMDGHIAEMAADGSVLVHYGTSCNGTTCKWVAPSQQASMLSACQQHGLPVPVGSAQAPQENGSSTSVAPYGMPTPNYLPQQMAQQVVAQHQALSFGIPMAAPHNQLLQMAQASQLKQQQQHLVGQSEDISAWIEAARDFKLNADFDIRGQLVQDRAMVLPEVMTVMKTESKGKFTIQALADKVMLHGMLENLGVPQLPALLSLHGRRDAQEVQTEVNRFVETSLQEGMPDCVLKPTHLSNGEGVLSLGSGNEDQRKVTIPHLVAHIQQHMGRQASVHESLALQGLRSGFLAQPKYQSVVGFKSPLELRVVTLFGKARLGVWWWGRMGDGGVSAPDFAKRNLWISRRLRRQGKLSGDDSWDILHDHQGNNPGWNAGAELIRRHMADMAATSEAVAKAFGAPFLRCDFFVGSSEWGVRLNEVAYGCGLDYRGRAPSGHMTDDGPVIAQILQRGMLKCGSMAPCEKFLTPLGVRGKSYEEMSVWPLPWLLRPQAAAQIEDSDPDAHALEVPDDLCRTFNSVPTHAPWGS